MTVASLPLFVAYGHTQMSNHGLHFTLSVGHIFFGFKISFILYKYIIIYHIHKFYNITVGIIK